MRSPARRVRPEPNRADRGPSMSDASLSVASGPTRMDAHADDITTLESGADATDVLNDGGLHDRARGRLVVASIVVRIVCQRTVRYFVLMLWSGTRHRLHVALVTTPSRDALEQLLMQWESRIIWNMHYQKGKSVVPARLDELMAWATGVRTAWCEHLEWHNGYFWAGVGEIPNWKFCPICASPRPT